jgi:hypothetical protein
MEQTLTSRSSFTREFRLLLMPWSFGLLLPFPILMSNGHSGDADIATLYLALGAAWVAAEAFRPGQAPATLAEWRTRIFALGLFLVISAALFVLLGTLAGVRSNIPLPLLAIFGVVPAIGIVPWLTLRLRQPYAAIVLGGFIVGAIKIAACVVARIVYGPDYIAEGYVSADWRTAKLMISLLWAGTILTSFLALLACRKLFKSQS